MNGSIVEQPLLTPSEVEAIFAPIERARTLPPRAFTDPAFFAAEREAIFFGGWAALCLIDLVPEVGDAAPLDFAGAPLLVVRTGADEIRVFHNLCPYDQCPVLLREQRGASKLISAYHGWEYDLQGRLTAAPFWRGSLTDSAAAVSHEAHDLRPVACGVFGKVLFVNVNGRAAQRFEDFVAPLRQRFGNLDFAALDIARDERGRRALGRLRWQGNWKTHHENACINIYHENFVHAIYQASEHVPRVDANGAKRYEEVIDAGLRGLSFSHEAAGDTYIDMGLPDLKRLDARATTHSTIVSLYPNLYWSHIGPHVHLTIVTPLDPDQVDVMTASYYDAEVARSERFAALRAAVEQGWEMAGGEDAAIVAAIHSARRSPAADAGYYSPFWDRGHWDLSRQIARDLGFQPRGA